MAAMVEKPNPPTQQKQKNKKNKKIYINKRCRNNTYAGTGTMISCQWLTFYNFSLTAQTGGLLA